MIVYIKARLLPTAYVAKSPKGVRMARALQRIERLLREITRLCKENGVN